MDNCLFCKIVEGSVAADIIYRDEHVVAFKDINHQAPVHLLIVPVKHIKSVADPSIMEGDTLKNIFKVIRELAEKMGCVNGYRVVSNCGEDGGQTVPHLHFHLLGKRALNWPPG